MEKIINFVTRLRRTNRVLSTEYLNGLISRYAFAFNDKKSRVNIAMDIQSAINDPNVTVGDCTLSFEEDQGCMTFIITKRQSNGVDQARLLSIHQSGVSYNSEDLAFVHPDINEYFRKQ